jgi:hypothetical protein
VPISEERVTTPENARRVGFRGSPTVLIDGEDPFADGRSQSAWRAGSIALTWDWRARRPFPNGRAQ